MKKEGKGGGRKPLAQLEYVEKLAEYIEQHLGEPLSAKMLADEGFASKGKLYRDFLNATGHTVWEYIRKRRLSNALALLKSSGFSYAEIAYECGYSSQQAMCRSIKDALGISPGQYREAEDYYFFPAYLGGAVFDIHVRQFALPKLFGFKFYQRSSAGIENNALALLFEKVPDFSGRLFGRNGQQRGVFFCYELYVAEYAVCQKLLESCCGKMPPFPNKMAVTRDLAFVKNANALEDVDASMNVNAPKDIIHFSKNNPVLRKIDFVREMELRGTGKAQGKVPLKEEARAWAGRELAENPPAGHADGGAGQNGRGSAGKREKMEERPQGWFEKGSDLAERLGLFALTMVENQEDEINDAWDYLCQSWLPLSMYEQEGEDYLEEYHLHRLEAKTLKLMLPIRAVKDYPKITIEKFPAREYIVAAGFGLSAPKQAYEIMGHFLDQCHLEHIRKKREFFYQEDTVYDKLTHNLCTRFVCGVPVDGIRQENLAENGVGVKTCEAGYYMVMRGKMPGEMSVYQEMLAIFAEQNHLSLVKESIFCLICADDGFRNSRTEYYGKILFRDSEQNDNTAGEDCGKVEM